jgi:benzoyl-CoA reductase subunit C
MSFTELIRQHRSKIDITGSPEIALWKQSHPGCKAVGYFPVYCPVELIDAAGMLPVPVLGSGGGIKLNHADSMLQSFVCAVGKSTLEMMLNGLLDDLDAMIFPSICEISRGVHGLWARHDPNRKVIYIHFPQNLKSPHALEYLLSELNRVKKILEEISGCEIDPGSIRRSIDLNNQWAELLKKLDKIRSEKPELLKTSEFYILRLASRPLNVTEHTKVLQQALDALSRRHKRPAPTLRMVLTGAFCERPPVSMIETIENEGIAIVADDLILGQRWWRTPIPLDGDPIRNLAEHYLTSSAASPVVYNPEINVADNLLKIIEEKHADGVIISSSKLCHPALHDSYNIVKACEEHGIPYLKLEFEEGQRVFESIRVQIEALLEARARLPFAGTDITKNEAGHK